MTDFKIGDRVRLPVGTIVGLERNGSSTVAKVRTDYGNFTETLSYSVEYLTLVAETFENPPLLPAGTVVRWKQDGNLGNRPFRWQILESGAVFVFDVDGRGSPARAQTGVEYLSRMVREGHMEVVDIG